MKTLHVLLQSLRDLYFWVHNLKSIKLDVLHQNLIYNKQLSIMFIFIIIHNWFQEVFEPWNNIYFHWAKKGIMQMSNSLFFLQIINLSFHDIL